MKTFVYFFGAAGRIKIGITRRVAERLQSVGSHMETPPILLGAIEGNRDLEQFLHRQLAEHRLKGEWFRDCEPVRDLMTRVLAEGPDGIGFVQPPPKNPLAGLVEKPRSDKEYAEMISALVAMIWPLDGLREFAAFTEQPESVVRDWLDGKQEIPRLVRYAFAAHAITWMFTPNK